MENSFSTQNFICLKLFPFISMLLSVKFKRLSGFISVLYIIILIKLKLKSIRIKSVSKKHFKTLIKRSKHLVNITGDIYGCALVSINTLIALSIKSASWIQICKISSYDAVSVDEDSTFPWKIKIPSVEKTLSNSGCHVSHYQYIQCLCATNVFDDFTLYVTHEKLFNISNLKSEESDYNDLVNDVIIENINIKIVHCIAESATVSVISSSHELTPENYQCMLSHYFLKPRIAIVGDVFKVSTKKNVKKLKSDVLYTHYVYFKVKKLSGSASGHPVYYIFKNFTTLYLDPPIHGYLPPVKTLHTDSFGLLKCDDTLSCCPDGLHKQYEHLQKLFRPFLKFCNLNVKPIFLLSGPNGSGKKITITAVASFFGLHFIEANSFDFYGLSPSLVKGKFQQLFAKARRSLPCVIYLENVELLGREQNYSENPRLLDIFMTQLSELWQRKPFAYPIYFVGSTSSDPLEIPADVARLFVDTVTFGVQKFDESYRSLNWLSLSNGFSCSSEVLAKISQKCKGYVYEDFVLLIKHALEAKFEEPNSVNFQDRHLSMSHFEKALEIMDAAYSDSIGAARVPSVHWEDIGGLANLKEEIMLTLNMHLKHPELFGSGLKRSGIIFYGPPGTGKTLMAKAIATECNYNFLSVKGPELMNMYVGESERNVRQVFEKARDAAPCIIFFDELDSLAPCRGKSGDSGGVTDRVVAQLLAEMDGLDENKDVFVLGATNRPDLVDPALLRPGRFDKMFYVGICTDVESKLSVLQALTRRFVLDESVNLKKIAKRLPNDISGADLYSVSSNAWFSAARKAIDAAEKGLKVSLPLVVSADDFRNAVEEFVPSLSEEDIRYYKRLNLTESR